MGKKKGRKEKDQDLEDVEVLPEDYTVADSVTTFDSRFDGTEFEENDDIGDDIDDHLHRLKGGDSAQAAAALRQSRLAEAWKACLEEFTAEKRSARRETRLRRLFRAVTHWCTGPMDEDTDPLEQACLYSLRTGQPAEQYAACRLVEASLCVGLLDGIGTSLDRQLRRIVETVQRETPVRVAAVRALAMSIWVLDHQEDAELFLDWMELVASQEYRNETTPAALRAIALDAWTLAACNLSNFYISGQDDVNMGRGLAILEHLCSVLEEDESKSCSMEVRAAAGQAISLINEARIALGTMDDAENVTARRFKKGTWEGSKFEATMDEIGQLVSSLATESRPHLSKKGKKEVRATFREFALSIVDDENPEEVVHFVTSGQDWTFHSWREIVPLNFLRHCLQGGFQPQMWNNAELQQVIGRSMPNRPERFSQLEKRMYWGKTSEVSKLQDRERTKNRDKRENVKNDFLLND